MSAIVAVGCPKPPPLCTHRSWCYTASHIEDAAPSTSTAIEEEQVVCSEHYMVYHRKGWQFHWSYDIKPILDIAYATVSLLPEEERKAKTEKEWLQVVYDAYFASRPLHGETLTHIHVDQDVTLSRTRDIPLDIVESALITVCQSIWEPNTVKRDARLLQWLAAHKAFSFGHILTYQPVWRGPN